MALLYVDTGAIVGAYLTDEIDHLVLRRLLLAGDDPIVTSEVTLVEFTSAIFAAHRGHRITDPEPLLTDFNAECGDQGSFNVIDFDRTKILPLARKLVAEHPLRTMEAIHLATALVDASAFAGGEDVAMVTRDQRQAAAAKACGLRVL